MVVTVVELLTCLSWAVPLAVDLGVGVVVVEVAASSFVSKQRRKTQSIQVIKKTTTLDSRYDIAHLVLC